MESPLKMLLEIHSVMQHTDDHDTLILGLIEDDMRLLSEAPKAGREIIGASTQFRVGA